MDKSVFVVSEWLAQKGKDQELWNQLKKIMDLSLEQEVGCLQARATRQIEHSGSPGKSKYNIVLLQEYLNIEAFDIHCKADYVINFFKKYIENEADSLVKEWTCRLFSEENR